MNHLRLFTLLCFWLGIVVLSLAFVLLYGIAGWGIGRRDARAAMLAFGLYSYRIVGAAIAGHFFGFNMAMGLVGVVLVIRAAEPLRLNLMRRAA